MCKWKCDPYKESRMLIKVRVVSQEVGWCGFGVVRMREQVVTFE
jgi:hypothetical protein